MDQSVAQPFFCSVTTRFVTRTRDAHCNITHKRITNQLQPRTHAALHLHLHLQYICICNRPPSCIHTSRSCNLLIPHHRQPQPPHTFGRNHQAISKSVFGNVAEPNSGVTLVSSVLRGVGVGHFWGVAMRGEERRKGLWDFELEWLIFLCHFLVLFCVASLVHQPPKILNFRAGAFRSLKLAGIQY